jgi:peptidyl-prolyl cis-trans isomerase SurA
MTTMRTTRISKRIPIVLLVLWALLDQLPAQANEPYKQEWTNLSQTTQDAIVASVGGQILLLSDLRRAVSIASRGQADLAPSGALVGSGLEQQQLKEILDKLIEQSLLEIKVKELSLEVTESELDQEIASFLSQRNIDRDDFLDMLSAEGETEQSHRAEFKRQLETQRFIGRVIKPLVSVTDEEVRSFYLSQRVEGVGVQEKEKITLRSLMLRGKATDPQVTTKVTGIQAALNAGSSFEEVTRQHSEAPDAKSTGGLLPSRRAQELPPAVTKELAGKAVGAIMGPIEIGSSSFMFELVARQTDADDQFLKEKDQWQQRLLERKFSERLESYLKSERDKVRIEIRPLGVG